MHGCTFFLVGLPFLALNALLLLLGQIFVLFHQLEIANHARFDSYLTTRIEVERLLS